jgi:hypothetical protein
MKNLPTSVLLLLAFLFISIIQVTAQDQKTLRISDADKKAIINLFKDVDPGQYRLVFNNGEEVYGRKRIKMSDLKTASRKMEGDAKGIKWTFVAGDRSENEVFYVYTEGESKMASLLGTNKLNALRQIAAKYNDLR